MGKMTDEIFISDNYEQQIGRLKVVNESLEENLKIQTGMVFKHENSLFN